MCGRDERVCDILNHDHGKALGEVLGSGVEVVGHSVAPSLSH